MIDWNNWAGEYSATVRFPDLEITSGQVIQQQRNNDVTLSLTCIVLFFASVDVVVVLYDHSEDKDEEKQAASRKEGRKGVICLRKVVNSRNEMVQKKQ